MAGAKEMIDYKNAINPVCAYASIWSKKTVFRLKYFLWYKQKEI